MSDNDEIIWYKLGNGTFITVITSNWRSKMKTNQQTIAVIGVGNMGTAIIKGLINTRTVLRLLVKIQLTLVLPLSGKNWLYRC